MDAEDLRSNAMRRLLASMVIMPEVSYSRYLNMVHGSKVFRLHIQRTAGILRKTVSEDEPEAGDHYIAGLSMGGGGAMWVGLQKPEQYGTICMLSTGGIAPLEGLWRSKSGDDTFYRKCNEDIYGTPDSDSLAGTEYDILKLIRETAKKHPVVPKVYHAMGTEDVRYPVAMKIKETFESIPGNPYDYEYHEGPGVHEWVFWDEWIHHFLDTVVQKGGR